MRTWVMRTDSDGFCYFDSSYVVSGDPFYIGAAGTPTFPLGTVTVQETKAPEGYVLSSAARPNDVFVQRITMSGIEGNPAEVWNEHQFLDDSIRGGVKTTKLDGYYQSATAQGDGTMQGATFAIKNASENPVVVGGVTYEPGKDVATITSGADGVAQTASDLLPYGTYELRETVPPEGYLLSDEVWRFEIREDGVIVSADAAGGDLEFRDQVVRNDLKISKKAEDTNESLQVPFAITNEATGETHVLVSDRNGQASTEASWNKHTANTNGNDHLLEADSITSEMMDSEAGIWFGLGEDGSAAPADDALAALPFGQYTLEELPCEANEGYNLITKTFWIDRDSGVAEAVWMTLDDQEGPKIGTQAADAADGDQIAQADEQATIVDTVYYENLEFGGTYTLTGTLMVKSTGEPLLDADGNPVTATKEFTANNTNGSVDIEFTFDASLLAGEDVVAFESMAKDGIEVATHADIEDSGQTVHFVDIGTTATDASDGDKLVTGSEVLIADEVSYEGADPRRELHARGDAHGRGDGRTPENRRGSPRI